jgi:hypothetical protein
VRSPLDSLWSGETNEKPWREVPRELEKQFHDVITEKYRGDWKAAISAFVKQHGKA